jgi:hypothetical protein
MPGRHFLDIRRVIYRMTRNISLLVLGLASIALSRIVFVFINDPEGPNLLVVMVLAAIIFGLSLAAYAGIRRYYKSTSIF